MNVLRIITLFLALAAASAGGPGPASAKDEIDCLLCHGEMIEGLQVHTAVSMGCPSCHVGIDAADVPHRITNSVKRGLLADQPELCFSCHDSKMFTNKFKHPALDMGCSSCHNPHGSKNARLLTTTVPELCFGCHDRGMFTRKVMHGPVSAGLCLQCHTPHSSRTDSLLLAEPVRICCLCHAQILSKPHLISGTAGKGHPLGAGKDHGEKRKIKDPARKGKRFTCASCHDPHSGDSPQMIRFPMQSSMDICGNCHSAR
ncbi:MAG: hypothetical protein OEW15_05755 [Nitrospirota bacterium]|nr:hypothetical protein [Nitrospirota bacterium]